MAEGNAGAGDDGAQKDAKIAQLEKDLAKQQDIVANAEKKINEWGNEIGQVRKEREEAVQARETAKQELAAMKQELAEVKAKIVNPEPGGNGGQAGGDGKGKKEQTAEEIEASLSPDARKVAEKVYSELSEAERERYWKDEKYRKTFLSQAVEAAPVPNTPWKNSDDNANKADSAEERIRKLFDSERRRSSHMPDGSRGGSNSGTGRGPAPSDTQRPEPTAIGKSVLRR